MGHPACCAACSPAPFHAVFLVDLQTMLQGAHLPDGCAETGVALIHGLASNILESAQRIEQCYKNENKDDYHCLDIRIHAYI